MPAAAAQAAHRVPRPAAGEPSASIETCAPPPVISRIAVAVSAGTAGVHDRLRAKLAGPLQRRARRRRPRPRGPPGPRRSSPRTGPPRRSRARPASPGADPAVRGDRPERRREPAAQARRGDEVHRPPGSATRFASAACTATSSANDPGPVNPGWVCRGQTWASPARQCSHRPQPQTNGTVTRSPAATGSPRARPGTTTPANSCPGMCGSATGSWPFQACQSDRHTPVAPTERTTPSSGQPGSGSLRQHRGGPVARVNDRLHEALAPDVTPRRRARAVVVAGEGRSSMLLTLPGPVGPHAARRTGRRLRRARRYPPPARRPPEAAEVRRTGRRRRRSG